MIENIIENIKKPSYWIPKIFLIALCVIHDKTKYHTARSISDLFYWPDGFCLDTAVIILFFVTAVWCVYKDSRIFIDMNA